VATVRPGAHGTALVVVIGLAASAAALAVAPVLMPDSYSWLSMTTSESAAQGVDGAWLARLGFLLFGLSVSLLAAIRHREWGPAGTGLHAGFGLFMVAAAGFSTRPWQPGAAYDRTEDTLHSVAATAMGFAFGIGVAAAALRARGTRRARRWPLDAVAVLASVLLPLAMSALPPATGALQRAMFAVAYAWYATEAVRKPAGTAPGRFR
jgi:hypothetical protein